jgi:adenylate cyclase
VYAGATLQVDQAGALVTLSDAAGREYRLLLSDTAKAAELMAVLKGEEVAPHAQNTEIERGFLVANDVWKKAVNVEQHAIKQGYVFADKSRAVRLRIQDGEANFCVKIAPHYEYEFDVPPVWAETLMAKLDAPVIEKTRYVVPASNGLKWEIDEFHGKLEGLLKAEIEVPSLKTPVPKPAWLGREVTDDARYKNGSLAFNGMPEEQRGRA